MRFGCWNVRKLYRAGSLTKAARELIFRKLDVGGMDWIGLAQGRDRLRAIVNAVMNLRVQ
jgi:hypothetical protein